MNNSLGSISTSVNTLSQLQHFANVISQYADELANILGETGVSENLQNYSRAIYGSAGTVDIYVNEILNMLTRSEVLLQEGLRRKERRIVSIAKDFQISLLELRDSNGFVKNTFGDEVTRILALIKKVRA